MQPIRICLTDRRTDLTVSLSERETRCGLRHKGSLSPHPWWINKICVIDVNMIIRRQADQAACKWCSFQYMCVEIPQKYTITSRPVTKNLSFTTSYLLKHLKDSTLRDISMVDCPVINNPLKDFIFEERLYRQKLIKRTPLLTLICREYDVLMMKQQSLFVPVLNSTHRHIKSLENMM